MDTAALKHTWSLAESLGDEVPLFFYSHLFYTHPELRAMFPVSMAAQRDRLVGALGRIVSNVDQLDEVTAFIQQLGRDHRRFEVIAEHYDAVGLSLLTTLKHFLGDQWTAELAADWAAAYGLIATVMVQAAEDSEHDSPASWQGHVIAVERKSMELAVVQVRPEPALNFEPGQSVAVETAHAPRLWRYLSIANAPRADGTLEFHVQLVPGGQVSSAIVRKLKAGDVLRLGAPVGRELTLEPEEHHRELLMVAGGTGFAPLRAHLERIDLNWQKTGQAPRVHLFHGARVPWNLYEHRLLQSLAGRPWFTYTPVVSDDPSYPGQKGLVGDAAVAEGVRPDALAMVCGSPAMVKHTLARLRGAGVASGDLRFEQFATLEEERPEERHDIRDGQPSGLPAERMGSAR
ncbi:globin domain-containing protein [Agromyces sp. S2-1-8]|uniref:globin domain-containing protein n=1 Tax=Agromyces sp. S2-1-8 TaxID=2897180 RepID=UPI001E636600|nr:globin domain-containing protein [Agromyces sp. S2-1-8]MCD5347260.1 globin domain-containing protein [Agromyces sp. S2-1-8]